MSDDTERALSPELKRCLNLSKLASYSMRAGDLPMMHMLMQQRDAVYMTLSDLDSWKFKRLVLEWVK